MKKAIKIIAVIIVGIIILGLAFFTVINFINKNKSAQDEYSFPGDAEMMQKEALSSPMAIGRSNITDSFSASSSGEIAPLEAPTDKKVIKNGSLSLKVESVDSAAQNLSQIAKDNGGEVFSTSISQNKNNIKSGSVTVKVPVVNFKKTIDEIKKAAVLVVRENTSGQDVTEQYQDLQVQLRNKQAEEQSFVRILDQAQKIDDILAVTRELSRTRGEIERLQGRIKFMESQTDMATITVSLTEDQDVTIVDSWRPLQIAKDAVNSLLKSVQGFISFLIVLMITVLPVAFLYFVVVYILYRIGKKIYLKHKEKKENNPPVSSVQ